VSSVVQSAGSPLPLAAVRIDRVVPPTWQTGR
jgi:hypothetical protein